MDLLNNLALGFGVAFTLNNLMYAFFGCVLGTLIGVLPGLGPVATIAMLLPSIYSLDATPALIMLAGIYDGAQTSFIPMLTLGIPPNAVMALMVGAMTIKGIQPGPQVMSSNPELFWGLIASMWVGNAMLVLSLIHI